MRSFQVRGLKFGFINSMMNTFLPIKGNHPETGPLSNFAQIFTKCPARVYERVSCYITETPLQTTSPHHPWMRVACSLTLLKAPQSRLIDEALPGHLTLNPL